MRFVGIDLAERHSAAVVLHEDGTVLHETVLDTGPKKTPPDPFGKAVIMAHWWTELEAATYTDVDERIWVIEDIPPHMMDPKPVLKLQGALIGFMVVHEIEAHLIRAKEWQDFFGYKKKDHGDSKKWAAALCEERGYVPGMTLPEGTKVLAKPKTDLRDAYLLAEWLRYVCLGLDSSETVAS